MPVGPVYSADTGLGGQLTRYGRTGEQIVSQAHGDNYEAASRGRRFSFVTGSSGVAPGTSLSTTGAHTIYNPIGSGYRLALHEVAMAYKSGTLGIGTLFLAENKNPNAAAVTGTALTGNPLDAGNQNGPAAAQGFTTSTLPAAMTAIDVLGTIMPCDGSGTINPTISKDYKGGIVIELGCSLTMHAIAAAGSSPLVYMSAIVEEVPIQLG